MWQYGRQGFMSGFFYADVPVSCAGMEKGFGLRGTVRHIGLYVRVWTCCVR